MDYLRGLRNLRVKKRVTGRDRPRDTGKNVVPF